LLAWLGGPPGIRDLELLENVIHRPRTDYYNGLVEMAAALFESLIINRRFVDGNKRVAFFSPDVFLRLNGWKLHVEPDEAYACNHWIARQS
jgi:death-on-curing protein